MKFQKEDTVYIIRLEKGERIIEKLSGFCKSKKITAAYFNGLGAVSEAELGHFDLETKKYSTRMFQGQFEIASLHGNVSLVKGDPFIHAHMTLGDSTFSAFAGHLREGTVGATCEIFIVPINETLSRKPDEITGLNLLDV